MLEEGLLEAHRRRSSNTSQVPMAIVESDDWTSSEESDDEDEDDEEGTQEHEATEDVAPTAGDEVNASEDHRVPEAIVEEQDGGANEDDGQDANGHEDCKAVDPEVLAEMNSSYSMENMHRSTSKFECIVCMSAPIKVGSVSFWWKLNKAWSSRVLTEGWYI